MNAGEIVVLGSSGHARVCIDILVGSGGRIVGCVAPDDPGSAMPVPYLGGDDQLRELAGRAGLRAFVAVGDNAARERLSRMLDAHGFAQAAAVSPAAVVAPGAVISPGCAVMPGAVVNVGARIEPGAIVNTNATVDHDCTIGRFAHIAPGVVLAGNVTVDEGAFLGAGTVVVPDTRIGAWAMVGAGSVVLDTVQPRVTVVGVPAHEIRAVPR